MIIIMSMVILISISHVYIYVTNMCICIYIHCFSEICMCTIEKIPVRGQASYWKLYCYLGRSLFHQSLLKLQPNLATPWWPCEHSSSPLQVHAIGARCLEGALSPSPQTFCHQFSVWGGARVVVALALPWLVLSPKQLDSFPVAHAAPVVTKSKRCLPPLLSDPRNHPTLLQSVLL